MNKNKTIDFMLLGDNITTINRDGYYYKISSENPKEEEWSYHPIDGWIGKWTSGCPQSIFFFKIIETNDPKIIL